VRGFGIGALARKRDATVRDRSALFQSLNQRSGFAKKSDRQAGGLDLVSELSIVGFYQ